MATLDLRLEHIESVESSINNAVTELRRRKNDYESIIKDINNIASSSSNLSNSNIYLKKKNSLLQGKMDKLNSFKNKVTDFSTNAKEADSRVATYVTDQSDIFYKTVGIKTGWSADWENFKKDCKNVKKIITEFYEKHKYYIDCIEDGISIFTRIAFLLITAIPTGGITLFVAAFELAKDYGNFITSLSALKYHLQGDDDSAEIWAKRGLKDGFLLLGDGIDQVAEFSSGTQTDFFRNLGGFVYNATDVFSDFICIRKKGDSALNSFKQKNFLSITFKNPSIMDNVDSGLAVKSNINTSWVKNIKQTYKISDNIIPEGFFMDNTKIVKEAKGINKSINDGLRNFQQMFNIKGIHPYVMKYGI